jgi:dolichol-phosphate mannosyltransferase
MRNAEIAAHFDELGDLYELDGAVVYRVVAYRNAAKAIREAPVSVAELVLEMDSDFSHDPSDLPRLIAAAEDGGDLVLGSRYVSGGSVSDWGLLRRLISRGGSWYARMILNVNVRDLTGGFKCFHRRVLESLDLNAIHADGYGFQIELTYRTIRAGFNVVEIPIVFRDRRVGESKMTARIALEAVWKVPALRRRG